MKWCRVEAPDGVSYAELDGDVGEAVSRDDPSQDPGAGGHWLPLASALVGSGADIVIPSDSSGPVEYEGELVAIIGKRAKYLSENDALKCVVGYTLGNDLSERMRSILKMAAIAAGIAMSATCFAQADAYPSKPIHFIVAFPAGNATDILARVFADKLSRSMKQSIIVENKPGAAGIIGTEFVAKAPPDGYTVLIGQSGALAVNPFLYKLNFDPQKDLAPVDLLITGATVLVTGADSPVKNLKDLIATARKEPGKLSYASYGAGHISHLMGEMFKSYAGVDILHVPYKSGPLPDVIAGRVDLIFEGTAVAMPQIKAGRLRPIAVMGAKRIPGLPDVPSVAEEFPGFDAPGWVGVLVPAGTPKPIIDRLNQELNDALASPEIRQRIADMLLEPAGGRPEEFGAFIRSQSERWGKVIRQAGITVE